MTKQRVKISSTGTKIFTVSEGGIDLTGADFSNTLFDADQRPTRVFSEGYMVITLIDWHIAPNGSMQGVQGPYTYATPGGQYPMLYGGWRFTPFSNPDFPYNSNISLGGGLAFETNNTLWGITINNNVPAPAQYINYLVLKNYG